MTGCCNLLIAIVEEIFIGECIYSVFVNESKILYGFLVRNALLFGP